LNPSIQLTKPVKTLEQKMTKTSRMEKLTFFAGFAAGMVWSGADHSQIVANPISSVFGMALSGLFYGIAAAGVGSFLPKEFQIAMPIALSISCLHTLFPIRTMSRPLSSH
jgi:hypothetical protein